MSELAADSPQKEVFSIKKWHAVAVWRWDTVNDNCAICRSELTKPCSDCQDKTVVTTCDISWGVCRHSFHYHCINEWLKTRKTCPLDNQEWSFQSHGFPPEMGNAMTNCCRRLCPRSIESSRTSPERERLIPPSVSPPEDFAFHPYGSFSQQNVDNVTPDRSTDVRNRIRNIMEGVENQIIDAGATRYPVLDTHESVGRSKYYSERVAHIALGPPVIPIILPRSDGNPVALITAPLPGNEQRRQIQELAKANSDAYQNLFAMKVDDLVVNFE